MEHQKLWIRWRRIRVLREAGLGLDFGTGLNVTPRPFSIFFISFSFLFLVF
jgi:hypothetical protein